MLVKLLFGNLKFELLLLFNIFGLILLLFGWIFTLFADDSVLCLGLNGSKDGGGGNNSGTVLDKSILFCVFSKLFPNVEYLNHLMSLYCFVDK